MIDLRHVRHLVAVASHSTLQEAADAIHLTQPALTKSIARLHRPAIRAVARERMGSDVGRCRRAEIAQKHIGR